MSKKYVVVTGAAGFIGLHLVERLLADGRSVIAIDNFLESLYPANKRRLAWKELAAPIEGNLKKYEVDLRFDDLSFLRDFEIDSIMNMAAMPGLKFDWGHSATYYECNLIALNRILDIVKDLSIQSFIQASTSSVYGKFATGKECSELSPSSPYGVSKLASEKLLDAYSKEFLLSFRILRYFSVYGPRQRPDMGIAKVIKCLFEDKPFDIYGDGENRRSSTYVDDIIEATLLAETYSGENNIFNISGNESHSLNQTIRFLEEISGKKLQMNHLPSRRGDQRETKGNCELAQIELKWTPKTSYIDGLQKQYKNYFDSNFLEI